MALQSMLHRALRLLLIFCCWLALASPIAEVRHDEGRTIAARRPGLLSENATLSDVEKARDIVRNALARAAQLNEARVRSPARNNYELAPGTKLKRSGSTAPQDTQLAPLLDITAEIAHAAALVAEVDAFAANNGSTTITKTTRSSSFWMENIDREGTIPWGGDAGYQVFRNVQDFGAWGDGVHDDTQAIKDAMMAASLNDRSSTRCAAGCYGSTTQNAIVYFPRGTYLVSSTIDVVFGTQLIGDAASWPTILAAPSFVGMGVLATDEYVPNGGTGPDGGAKEWYINTASFYRQIRNIRIDIRPASQSAYICALHYQVAQATSLQFVELISTNPSDNPSTTQQGMFAENGSGGHISDVTFTGGNFGLYGGSQQFTAQRLTFNGCKTGVQLIWDWGWTWKSVEMNNVDTGFRLTNSDGTGSIGSVYIMDSKFNNVNTAILTKPASKDRNTGTTGITLDNVAFTNVQHYVYDTSNYEYVQGSPTSLDTWTLGPVYFTGTSRDVSLGYSFATPREATLVGGGNGLPKSPFFERAKPQYEDVDASAFVHVKDHGCKGDGATDDTAAFQRVLDQFSGSDSIIFVDSGTYILTDTVTVPTGTRIVGEAWSQLAASGPNFSDATEPRIMFRVGNQGDRGSVEIQDILFTTKGATPGAVLVAWNLLADQQGSAGMWDTHFRLGGATGTGLTPSECPASTSGVNSGCSVGSLMMHITPSASAYLENVWLWVADHMSDDPDRRDDGNGMAMVSVYNARGLLVESRSATWLYGTASEHSVYYQYNFHNAKNVFAGMIQTESPYYQPSPQPPAPFQDAIGAIAGDPEFQCSPGEVGCDASWAVLIANSENIFIAGAGLYSWFQAYSQTCIDAWYCQNTMVFLKNTKNVIIHNLITIGGENMLVSDGSAIPAGANQAIGAHPWWSQLTVFYPIQGTPDARKRSNHYARWHGSVPDGEYFPSRSDIITWPGRYDSSLVTYVTLLNGSPHDFHLNHTHTYQVDPFGFDSVPAGSARQNKQQYQNGTRTSFVDDKAEAFYRIDGTDSTFQIWARTNSGDSHKMHEVFYFENFRTDDQSSGSSTELGDRGGYRAFNFVVTGSEKYGHYWTSLNPPIAWMSAILNVIGGRKLRHVCMIGSHDAGMSTLNGNTAFVTRDNTDTQHFNIYDQLRAGSRFFDIRPVVGNGGQYLVGHYNVPADIVLGGNGEYITDIVNEVNSFTANNAELVILHVSHAYNTDDNYRGFNDGEYNHLFDLLEGLTHRCGGMAGDLTDKTMNEFIGSGSACVIIISDDGPVRPDRGIYKTSDSFGWDGEGHWSDTDSISDMASDQLSYLASHRNIVASDLRDKFLVMQWVLTLQGIENVPITSSTGIEAFATRWPYDALFWKAWNAFTPWSYPNVVLLDYVGHLQQGYNGTVNRELAAFAMAVNLAIASANDYVGGGTIY